MLTASIQSSHPPARGVRQLRLAVAGCGVVGGELLRIIERERYRLAAHRGLRLTIASVLVRDRFRPRGATVAPGVLTSDVDEFLATEADIVVEAIGGLDPAARIARSALTRGIHLVTANKAVVAAHGGELAALAHASGATFRFDAAVGGGVPVLRVLTDALGGRLPRSVRGILNGTSNFVLTKLEEGATLEEALRNARARGFAEADASRDLDGRDAADKLAIVAWTAFGIRPEALVIRRRGLLPNLERFVRLAADAGGRLRFVAECELAPDGGVVASVEPALVGRESALGRAVDEANHVEIDTGWGGVLSVTGPGAGGQPTAMSLLSDLVSPFIPAGARTAAAQPSDDARCLPWIVGARNTENEIRVALDAAGIALRHLGTSSAGGYARTTACRWETLLGATTGLASPLVARDEMPGAGRTGTDA